MKRYLALLVLLLALSGSMAAQSSSGQELVRIAEIEVHPEQVETFRQLGQEVARLSLTTEPGVLCLYPVQVAGRSNAFRVIEVYRDSAAYEAHLQTPHFLRYKEASRPLVTSLKLLDTTPLSPELLQLILRKSSAGASSLERVITLEEHFIIPQINQQVQQYLSQQGGGKPLLTPAQQELQRLILPDGAIAEVGAQRLAFMDSAGVTMQVLSYGAGGPQNLPDTTLAVRLCRQANDSLARLVAQAPDRFAGFALLPMVSGVEAARELERSVRELGLCGAMISGSPLGRHLDAQAYRPLFAKAAELGVPLYLHPGAVPAPVASYYTAGEAWSEVAAAMLATAGYLWHADSGLEVIRLIMSGLFEEYPSLQLISGHWGELVPFYLNRLDDQQSKVLSLPKKISEYYRSNVYVTPSGFFSEAQLRYAIETVGADRILYAADYPFLRDTQTRSFLEGASISQHDKELIAYRNAERLLRLRH